MAKIKANHVVSGKRDMSLQDTKFRGFLWVFGGFQGCTTRGILFAMFLMKEIAKNLVDELWGQRLESCFWNPYEMSRNLRWSKLLNDTLFTRHRGGQGSNSGVMGGDGLGDNVRSR